MAQFKVLQDGWKNADGEHKEGDTVEIATETPGEKAEADKLARYGIVELISEDATERGSAKKK